jgi:hypothetical protein
MCSHVILVRKCVQRQEGDNNVSASKCADWTPCLTMEVAVLEVQPLSLAWILLELMGFERLVCLSLWIVVLLAKRTAGSASVHLTITRDEASMGHDSVPAWSTQQGCGH